MRQLDRLVLQTFAPVFVIALVFFVLIIQLVDLFSNLVRFLNADISWLQIGYVQLLYLPKAVSFSLPIAVLFAASFALGSLHSNNELIAVFSAGISLFRFVMPLLVLGLVLSAGWYFFEEHVVIDSFHRKNEITQQFLNMNRTASQSNVTVFSREENTIYSADYYNSETKTLSGVILIQRNEQGRFVRRINADRANWESDQWVLHNVQLFEQAGDGSQKLTLRRAEQLAMPELRTDPATFRRSNREIAELTREEAQQRIANLREAGLSHRRELTNYHDRFSFALTPFVVTLLSTAIGGRFKKNVLLMSLLVSLALSVLYYVFGMITELLAVNGAVQPAVGAWASTVVFLVAGTVLLSHART
jgi:lipopolysaccharide export system permease protein